MYFPTPAQLALLRAMLVIGFLSPTGSLVCVWQPMNIGDSFFPASKPTGIDLLSSSYRLFSILSEVSASWCFCLPHAFTLVSFLPYSSTLKMEETCSSETLVDFQRATHRYIPEDRTLHNRRLENLKSYNTKCTSTLGYLMNKQQLNAKHILIRRTENGGQRTF
jgi:hypothetical protein